jgi:hypothetical protein
MKVFGSNIGAETGYPDSLLVYISIEKNEMGGACGTYGRGERGAQGVGGKT